MGEQVDDEALQSLRDRYGMGQPVYVQYGKWVYGIVTRGDWGQSMEWQRPVSELIWENCGIDRGAGRVLDADQLGDRHPHGRVLGDAPVFAAGLCHVYLELPRRGVLLLR